MERNISDWRGPVNSNNKGADRRGQGLSQGRRQQDSKAGTTAPGARRLGSTTRQVRSFLKTFQAHFELVCGKRNQGGPPASAERRVGAANQVPLTVSTSNLHHQQVQHHPLTQIPSRPFPFISLRIIWYGILTSTFLTAFLDGQQLS